MAIHSISFEIGRPPAPMEFGKEITREEFDSEYDSLTEDGYREIDRYFYKDGSGMITLESREWWRIVRFTFL